MKHLVKKVLSVLLLTLILAAGMSETKTFASDSIYLYDGAGLLSPEEQEALNSQLTEISERLDFNVVVVTTTDLDYKTPMSYADDFYDEVYGPNTDGCLFLRYIDGSDREIWISTSGIGLKCIYDDYIDFIFDAVDSYFDTEEYYYIFRDYAYLVDDTVSRYKETGSPVDIWSNSGKTEYYDENNGKYFVYNSNGSRDYSISYGFGDWVLAYLRSCILPLIVAFIIALAITGSWKRKLNSVQKANSAKAYEKKGSFELSRQSDVYLRSTVSKVKIESSSSSSGGHSSSSHHSSGGGSHGGGGRHR
ncbi:MAG: TPM domain-containing protein [Lachnospiraceae bacterium]|nr:TPM domain-containing protein [Lachnospiraceae bacterium]